MILLRAKSNLVMIFMTSDQECAFVEIDFPVYTCTSKNVLGCTADVSVVVARARYVPRAVVEALR